ncbi:hypothetical protein X769_31845 [Mesorhizobium sp. LSJC268A00]|nr:hypothetical protein X769_31845 [Mesorhizobium sp. LSJC268A00]
MKRSTTAPIASHKALMVLSAFARLEFGEGVLNRIEVGTVGRQVEQARACGLDLRP